MIHHKPHLMKPVVVSQLVIEGTTRGIIPFLEIHLPFPVQLAWGYARVEEGILAINLLFHHQDFAYQDRASWQEGQIP